MPNCSVLSCRIRQSPNITLHRLPKNDRRRKMWLDTIGVENLMSRTKTIFVCSLHFDESCFNRTLNITTLREDATPSRIILLPARSSTSSTSSEIDPNHTPSTDKICDASDELPARSITSSTSSEIDPNHTPSTDKICDASDELPARSSTSSTSSEIDPNHTPSTYKICDASDEVKNVSSCVCQDRIPSTSNESLSNLPVPDATLEIIKQLNLKCENYKKKIKRLNEKVRRQKKKIIDFSNVIKLLD